MSTYETDAAQYMKHLECTRRVTKATLLNYASTLRRFGRWADERGASFEESSVIEFLQSIEHAPSANVMSVRLVGLSNFLRKPIKVCRAKEEHREPEALTSAEILRLTASCDPSLTDVVTLLVGTGLRFSEFCGLSKQSLHERGGVFWLSIFGKGRKHRLVPLSSKALESFHRIELGYTQYQGDLMRTALAKAGVSAGMPYHVHPHLLRGSMISIALNERCIDAIKVAKIVGHASVDTMTKHYYRASIESLLEAVA